MSVPICVQSEGLAVVPYSNTRTTFSLLLDLENATTTRAQSLDAATFFSKLPYMFVSDD